MPWSDPQGRWYQVKNRDIPPFRDTSTGEAQGHSGLMESKPGSGFCLAHFLDANRRPSSGQARGHASLEKARAALRTALQGFDKRAADAY
jgi:hypothetical protein